VIRRAGEEDGKRQDRSEEEGKNRIFTAKARRREGREGGKTVESGDESRVKIMTIGMD
jgi:hypothetical protein